MIADCEAGLIDMVITKSISRFARNTADCLQYTRLLRDKGIGVVSLLIVVRRASSMRAASSFLFIIPLPYFNNDNTDLGQYLLSADESTSAYTLYLKSASYWTCGSK